MSQQPTPTAYPLQWPIDQPRTAPHARERGIFKGTLEKSCRELSDEVSRTIFGSTRHFIAHFTLSTNIVLRADGFPRSGQRDPDDPGAALYFRRDGKDLVFACDRYDKVWKNVKAIAKTLEALRGIERWGSKQLFDRAFTGFAALPERSRSSWRVTLRVDGMNHSEVTIDVVKAFHRTLYREALHSDAGDSRLIELNDALEQAKKELS